jgi:glucose/arabinose dehydrogenase
MKIVNFLDGDTVLGRPVDIAQAPDGSLVFSDDNKHKVYRLEYVGK